MNEDLLTALLAERFGPTTRAIPAAEPRRETPSVDKWREYVEDTYGLVAQERVRVLRQRAINRARARRMSA